MIDWAKRHMAALAVAILALLATSPFILTFAQSADLFLARALHVDGDVSTAATDRALVIQGDDGANYRTISTDTVGDLQVDVLSSVGAGSMTDDAAFTPATSTITAVGGTFDDTTPDSVDEGDGGAFRMSARREMYTQIRDAGGSEIGLDVLADDAAFAGADNLILCGAKADDTNPDSVNEGDVGAPRMSLNRSLHVEIRDAADNERGLNIDANGALTVGTFPDNEPINMSQWGGSAVTGGAGAVAAGTPRMTLASDDPAVASLSVVDDWDETNRAAVNLIAGQVAITAGAGAVAANTPRMTLGSDDPAVASLSVVDDWDETNRAAVNLIAGQVAIAGGLGADAANVPRVSIVSDQTVLEVQGDQIVPQVPASVACDTTGAVAFTANAADVRLSVWNTSTTQDVCIRFGASTGADITNLATCTVRLGTDAGSGPSDLYETPAGFRIGAEVFSCDVAASTATVVVTAWRTQ